MADKTVMVEVLAFASTKEDLKEATAENSIAVVILEDASGNKTYRVFWKGKLLAESEAKVANTSGYGAGVWLRGEPITIGVPDPTTAFTYGDERYATPRSDGFGGSLREVAYDPTTNRISGEFL